MGLLDIFKKDNTEKPPKKVMPWIGLTEMSQLDTIKENSKGKTQLIFKDSTRCGISKMVMNLFVETYDFTEEDLDLYYLDLLSHRDVSDEVGYSFQVLHQSPQLLVIKDGVVVVSASHGGINDMNLKQYILKS